MLKRMVDHDAAVLYEDVYSNKVPRNTTNCVLLNNTRSFVRSFIRWW